MAVVNKMNLYNLFDERTKLRTVGTNDKLTPAGYKQHLDDPYQWYHIVHGFINPFTKSLEPTFALKQQSQRLELFMCYVIHVKAVNSCVVVLDGDSWD